jgi:hypothetical protein
MRRATRTIARTRTIASTIHPHGVDDDVEPAVVVDVVVGCAVVVVSCVVVVVAATVVVVVGASVVVVVVGASVVVVVVGGSVVVVAGWAATGPAGVSPKMAGRATATTSADTGSRPTRRMRSA